MIIKYRLVKYEANDEELMGNQLGHSIPVETPTEYTKGVVITVYEINSADAVNLIQYNKAISQNRKFFDSLVLLAGEYEIANQTNDPEYAKIKKILAESDESVRG
jgi:fructose-specific phosphotransferase system component IIB